MQSSKTRKIARGFWIALTCSTTPFVPVDQAFAQGACVTDTTTNIVTCSGGDIPGGFGTGIETGLTINVVGANTNVEGINVQDATINNGGSIAPGLGALAILGNNITLNNGTGTVSGGSGISANSVIVTSNDGTITGSGASGIAIQGGTATVANGTGTISGVINGILGGSVTVTSNNGTIEATNNGAVAIQATNGDANVTNGSGSIQANGSGSSAINVLIGALTVNNGTGTIQANGGPDARTGIGSRAIGARAGVTVTGNDGVIEARGAGGIAIGTDLSFAATVSNGVGRITGDAFAIRSSNITVNGNGGTIEAIGVNGVAISAADFGGTASVTSSGTISGTTKAIETDRLLTLNNSGLVSSGGAFAAVSNNNNVTVTNSGTIRADNGVAVHAFGTATVNNLAGGNINGGGMGISAGALNITNASGATISGGNIGISGSGTVRNAGTISGTNASVSFFNTAGPNTLILQTGSVLNGDAVGSTAGGATNNLVLQGHGTASNTFSNFNHLDVNADTSWFWNNASPTIGTTAVNSGTFVLNSALQTTLTVNSGGTLAGQGHVTGNVTVAGGGTVAPGAAIPFTTLSSGGVVVFQPGSAYRVNVNAAGQNDKFAVGSATLNGAAVNVLAQNGTYAPSTRYTILTASGGGLGGTNQFGGVTTNLAFLTPTLTYDANDVFLTLGTNGGGGGGTIPAPTGFGFANAALTRNQHAVAGALDASPATSALVLAQLNQTVVGARAAFDALSGEIFGSVHNTQDAEASFARSAMLGRMRQASYADVPGELGALGFAGPQLAYASGDAYAADANGGFPAKAPRGATGAGHDLTFWAQGLGGWAHADSDGNAASLKSRFGGFLSGADARFGDAWRAGLVAGYMRTDLNVADRSSSAGIDSVQFGGYVGGRLGAFNVRGGASYSYDSIDVSRGIFFPGFSDKTSARFHGNVGQIFGEIGYGMALGSVAIEPLAGLAYVHVHDGSFAEASGLAALSAASANENTGYSTLGLRAATAVPLADGTVLVPRGSLQWQYAFGDVTPVNALAFQSTGTSFTVAGIPIARNTALVEAGFDWRFSRQAKLGAFYQGELAAHADTHAIKGAFSWDF